MTAFTTPTGDFTSALAAVVVHADTDPDMPQLHRVRVDVGVDTLTVAATNRYTAALALANVVEHVDAELEAFDIGPADVKKIRALFRPRKVSGGDLDDLLRVDVTDEHLTITDVSGLFPGQSLTLCRYPAEENFPNLAGLIADRMAAARPTAAVRLTANAAMVALFAIAGRVYGEPLVIETTAKAKALLITCGESFAGLLMPMGEDADRTTRENEWRTAWLRRFDAITPA